LLRLWLPAYRKRLLHPGKKARVDGVMIDDGYLILVVSHFKNGSLEDNL